MLLCLEGSILLQRRAGLFNAMCDLLLPLCQHTAEEQLPAQRPHIVRLLPCPCTS